MYVGKSDEGESEGGTEGIWSQIGTLLYYYYVYKKLGHEKWH